jgi:anthranilate phosphoribosyltransferase
MPVRKSLGIPTIFNLLGPLTNPAGAQRQVVGVYAPQFVRPVADALAKLGAVRAVVLHGVDGLDECSISAPTIIAEVRDGVVSDRVLSTDDLGVTNAPHSALVVHSVEDAARLLAAILNGSDHGPCRDMVVANAGLAIMAAGLSDDLLSGMRRAGEVIDSGEAARTLEQLRAASNH